MYTRRIFNSCGTCLPGIGVIRNASNRGIVTSCTPKVRNLLNVQLSSRTSKASFLSLLQKDQFRFTSPNPFRYFSTGISSKRKLFSASEGDLLHGFQVKKVVPVKEYELIYYELEHMKTGAVAFHIARDDPDNAFGVGFRTPNLNSNGVAHILEHTTLCGSEKYPVRDPFFHMTRRSLKTYMNAWTFPEFTLYPFSTQNESDYNNLLDVYLDCVFFPRLREKDFQQEGHRIEISEEDGLFNYKGVVFNEMKGQLSDPNYLFYKELYKELFDSDVVIQHYNSGGDPNEIPQLTYEGLKAFHSENYHPSNSCIFSYGDMNPPLEKVNDIIKSFEKKDVTKIAEVLTRKQKRFTQPKTLIKTCPEDPLINDPLKQTKICVSFLCNVTTEDIIDTFSLSILSLLLLEGPTAPMYKALIDPQIGNDYAPVVGYDSNGFEGTFSFGLQGISESDTEKVKNIIFETLKKCVSEGFPKERIDALLHQIEFGQKSVKTQFGIRLISDLVRQWVFRSDPSLNLQLNYFIKKFKEGIEKGHYLEGLIEKYLLNNPHYVTFIMKPDPEYLVKEAEIENAKLKKLREMSSNDDKQKLIQNAELLRKSQDEKPDPECLPTLKAVDIPRKIRIADFRSPSLEGPLSNQTHFDWIVAPTNDIVYWKGLVDLSMLPKHLRPYLSIYSRFFTEVGTKQYNYRELAQEIDMYMGGISSSVSVFSDDYDIQRHKEYLLFSAQCLERNCEKTSELVKEVISSSLFSDMERICTILSQALASESSSLADNGHTYARLYASANLNTADRTSEQLGGLTHLRFLHTVLKYNDESVLKQNLEKVIQSCYEIGRYIREQGFERCLVTTKEGSASNVRPHFASLTDFQVDSEKAETNNSLHIQTQTESLIYDKIFFGLPMKVNHASLCIPTIPLSHPDAPKLLILGNIMSSLFIHKEVREKGGAYGSGARWSSNGVFSFYSFRDPNVFKTLDAFKKSVRWIVDSSENFSDRDIEEALLSAFSNLDSPLSPGSVGVSEWLTGRTDAQRQEFRDGLLNVTHKSLVDAASQHLLPAFSEGKKHAIAIVGNKDNIPEEIKGKKNGWEMQYAVEQGLF